MREYFTLTQDFDSEINNNRNLGEFLTEQGIVYKLGADFDYELAPFEYIIQSSNGNSALVKIYVVLIEKHELSAIMLSVGGVQVIQNKNSLNIKNKIRSMFSWFVN